MDQVMTMYPFVQRIIVQVSLYSCMTDDCMILLFADRGASSACNVC